jgi:hypothetical protein
MSMMSFVRMGDSSANLVCCVQKSDIAVIPTDTTGESTTTEADTVSTDNTAGTDDIVRASTLAIAATTGTIYYSTPGDAGNVYQSSTADLVILDPTTVDGTEEYSYSYGDWAEAVSEAQSDVGSLRTKGIAQSRAPALLMTQYDPCLAVKLAAVYALGKAVVLATALANDWEIPFIGEITEEAFAGSMKDAMRASNAVLGCIALNRVA